MSPLWTQSNIFVALVCLHETIANAYPVYTKHTVRFSMNIIISHVTNTRVSIMNDLDRHSHLNRDIKSHTPNPNPTLHGVTKYEKKYDQNTSCNCKVQVCSWNRQVLEEKQWEATEQWMWLAAEKVPLHFNVASSCRTGCQLLADLHHSSDSQPKQTPDN